MPRHNIRPQIAVIDAIKAEGLPAATPSFQERTESSIPVPSIITPTQTEPTQTPSPSAELGVESPSKKSKRKPASVSQWYAHKRTVAASRPDLSSVEQLILAKKSYTPSGRIRSAQSIHREAYLLRNPNHGLEGGELEKAIRNDLIARI